MSNPSNRPVRPLCLITGASAGIGAAIAREYASLGWDLALVARREEPMVELATELKTRFKTTSHIFVSDLFDVDATKDLMARIHKKGLQIDGLVNNAGYGHPGVFTASPWEDHAKYLQLMLTAPCEMTRAVLPDMQARGFGRIINVASLAGHMPGSRGHTLYAAIKSFLIKFSESLNAENDGTDVHISALCPGFTYSEFHDVNGTREGVSQLPDAMWMSAEDCAAQAVEAVERNRAVFIPGSVNKGLAILNRILPAAVSQKLMAKNSEKIRKQ
ncbi:SDR family NAD(P)-dependent oxidoreductase [Fretibacter rubidus]|uniref:SDR family NAD(P)-dependent oxidoreductase n=1 Tax=Fretibacter rubidus TaxID=570162 RepID=UPI00352B7B2C